MWVKPMSLSSCLSSHATFLCLFPYSLFMLVVVPWGYVRVLLMEWYPTLEPIKNG